MRIVFEKNKRSWWDSKQNEFLCGSSHPKGSLKQVFVMRDFAEFTRTYLCWNLFFDNVINSVDLQLQKEVFSVAVFL